jgi:hypothetical protein
MAIFFKVDPSNKVALLKDEVSSWLNDLSKEPQDRIIP